jgi:hypothetical protein
MQKNTLSVRTLLVVYLSVPFQADAQQAKPNIVVLLADNLGYGELGVYGGGIHVARPLRALTSSPAKACGCSPSTSRRSVRPRARLS